METVLVVAGNVPGVGGMDSGGQAWLTAHAMREYLNWDAHSLVFQTSYLDYPVDWLYNSNVTDETLEAYADTCTFFVFLDSVHPAFGKWLKPHNYCVIGVGTGLRHRADYVLMDQIKHGMSVIVPPQDETVVNRVIGTPFDFVIVDCDEIDSLTRGIEQNGEFTVCHAHTHSSHKGVDVIESLHEQFPDVVFDEISGLSWADAIKRKAKAHVVLDDFLLPTYGLNVLESGVLGQIAISNIGPWCYMIYPDLPFITVNPAVTGISMLECASLQLKRVQSISADVGLKYPNYARPWVLSHHHPAVVAEKWKWYVRWQHSQEVR